MLNSEKHRENFKFFMCNTINVGERPAKRTKNFLCYAYICKG